MRFPTLLRHCQLKFTNWEVQVQGYQKSQSVVHVLKCIQILETKLTTCMTHDSTWVNSKIKQLHLVQTKHWNHDHKENLHRDGQRDYFCSRPLSTGFYPPLLLTSREANISNAVFSNQWCSLLVENVCKKSTRLAFVVHCQNTQACEYLSPLTSCKPTSHLGRIQSILE